MSQHLAVKNPSRLKRKIGSAALALAVLAGGGVALLGGSTAAQAASTSGSCTATIFKVSAGGDSTPLAGATFGANIEQRDEQAYADAKNSFLTNDPTVAAAVEAALAAQAANDANSQTAYETAFATAHADALAAALAPWIEKYGSVADAEAAQAFGAWASFKGAALGSPEVWATQWSNAQSSASFAANAAAPPIAEDARAQALADGQSAVDEAFAASTAARDAAVPAAEAHAATVAPWNRVELPTQTTGADGVVIFKTSGSCSTFLAQETFAPEGFTLNSAPFGAVWAGSDSAGTGTATWVNEPVIPVSPEPTPTPTPEVPVTPESPKPTVPAPVVETPAPAPAPEPAAKATQVVVTAAL